MSEAILKFNLPEESYEFNSAVNAIKFRSVLSELDNFLRNTIKYAENLDPIEVETYRKARDYLFQLCEDYDINIHE